MYVMGCDGSWRKAVVIVGERGRPQGRERANSKRPGQGRVRHSIILDVTVPTDTVFGVRGCGVWGG